MYAKRRKKRGKSLRETFFVALMLMPIMPLKVIPSCSRITDGIRTFYPPPATKGEKVVPNGTEWLGCGRKCSLRLEKRVIFLLSNAAANSYTHRFMGPAA